MAPLVKGVDPLYPSGYEAARRGESRRLRRIVLPPVLAAADEFGVSVRLNAAAQSLVALYQADMPGLVDVGPARSRGRRMLRQPAP